MTREHDPDKAGPGPDPGWLPVSRLREAQALTTSRAHQCFGGRRQVGKDHAQTKGLALQRRAVGAHMAHVVRLADVPPVAIDPRRPRLDGFIFIGAILAGGVVIDATDALEPD